MLASLHEDVERLTLLLCDINSVSLVSQMETKDLKLSETPLAKQLAFQEAL